MSIKVLSLLCYASVLTSIESARILAVFPFPSISHQVVFRKLTLGLANKGHDITVMTTDPAFPKGDAPSNFKEIDVKDISYKKWQTSFQDDYKVDKDFDTFSQMRRSIDVLGGILKIQFETPEMQEIITNTTRKFDLILVEALMHPAIVLSHILKAPLILVSSLGGIYKNHHIMGAPTHPLLYPSIFHRRLYKLTIWEKLIELYDHFLIDYAVYLNEADETAFIRQLFGPDIPTINELYNNVDMLFLNINPIWADNRPVPPNVVYMGGIHQSPEKELPNDLKTYLDSSKHGVIYLSFGTNVLSGMIPTDKVQMIIKVLSNLPYNVLWKWDKDELPGKSNNIKISKWFPQSDLLKHPKVKLFITQAGLQSTDEAITAGVPLVAIPMLGDQWYNAEKYVKHGIGKQLDIDTLTEELFKNAVETVITDESYRKNIIRLRQLMHDQPETPLDRAIWWAEYVIRHGGAKELRPPSANLSFVEYYEVKLILIVVSVVLIAIITFVLAVLLVTKYVKKNICRNVTKKKLNYEGIERHPKVKLFITQAGLQSTYEAINGGVPLLAIPMLGDQWYNAEKYVKHGIGKKINIESLTATELQNTIESIIRDERYRKNILKLRDLLQDQPESSLDRAIWWTEYVIRHGGAKHLRPPSANISYAEYFQIDRNCIYTFQMVLKSLSICLIVSVIVGIKSAKILAVFPMPSISHQVVFRPLTQELAKRGHDVTVITPDPAFTKGSTPPNLKEIDVHDISYQTWQNLFLNEYKVDGGAMDYSVVRQIGTLLAKMFKTQIQSPEVQKLINDKNNKFDLLILEAMIRPALVFSHIFEAPVILVSSLGMVFNYHKVMGLHTHPILYPLSIQQRLYNLTLMEKLKEIYHYYSIELAHHLNTYDENKELRSIFGSSVPSVSELSLKIDMLFINIHPLWAENQPVPQNVVYIGGIHILPEKKLPKDLQTYLDSSKNGVIYLSFGTNVLAETIPTDKIQIIVEVLSELPYEVLWKWDKDDLPGKSSNIKLSKWYPQSDLLRHPNVKLFITQAGLQSTDEAITAGVPVVGIPMLGDQWYNAEKYVKHGIGKKLNIESLTSEEFRSVVVDVINDDRYRKNIVRLRQLRNDLPMSPFESAMWWIEYVMRHGGAKHLRTSTANLSYAEYFELEVLLVLISLALACIFLLISIIFFIVRTIKYIFYKQSKLKRK
ncbi:uncharacterized protein LOC112045603 [Bicyclus anynana]|uniref:Uncharacterized protein LOC112045603 n=1 Tax=Bicyclus anynana TaxID=110368 RepID=A0ABM3LPR0_BICAN|nr:uncharacterized protein LOC112045603 [Bicyclus anynana]